MVTTTTRPATQVKKKKIKISKCGHVKFKRHYTAKETIKKMKRQPTEWGKTFANYIFDKGFVYEI